MRKKHRLLDPTILICILLLIPQLLNGLYYAVINIDTWIHATQLYYISFYSLASTIASVASACCIFIYVLFSFKANQKPHFLIGAAASQILISLICVFDAFYLDYTKQVPLQYNQVNLLIYGIQLLLYGLIIIGSFVKKRIFLLPACLLAILNLILLLFIIFLPDVFNVGTIGAMFLSSIAWILILPDAIGNTKV